ncbi:MAG: hypothetical protein Q9218_007604 [Villophora microphyllina]
MIRAAELKAGDIKKHLNTPDRDDYTSMDYAVYRRDQNLEWSKFADFEPDEDPREYYRAFKSLIRDVFERSTGKKASFRWKDNYYVVVASDTTEDKEDVEGKSIRQWDWDSDETEEDDVHTTDEEGSDRDSDEIEEDDVHTTDEEGSDRDSDKIEKDDVHTTDEEGSAGSEEDQNPEDQGDEGDGDDRGEGEEVWEDAPESLPFSTLEISD